jgi:hypothetical protein
MLKNFTLIGDAGLTNAKGISTKYFQKGLIEDIISRNMLNDLDLDFTWNVDIKRFNNMEPVAGAYARIQLIQEINCIKFDQCYLTADPLGFNARILTSCAAVEFNSCSFQYGMGVTSAGGSLVRALGINNSYTEWMQGEAIQMRGDVDGFIATGNYFNGNTITTPPINSINFAAGSAKGVTIIGNNFNNWSGTPIANNFVVTDLVSLGNSWDNSDTVDIINNMPANSFLQRRASYEIRAIGGITIGPSASGNPMYLAGNGSPEGILSAPVGSRYARKDGGAGTSFYVKETGTGNTGWVAK